MISFIVRVVVRVVFDGG